MLRGRRNEVDRPLESLSQGDAPSAASTSDVISVPKRSATCTLRVLEYLGQYLYERPNPKLDNRTGKKLNECPMCEEAISCSMVEKGHITHHDLCSLRVDCVAAKPEARGVEEYNILLGQK